MPKSKLVQKLEKTSAQTTRTEPTKVEGDPVSEKSFKPIEAKEQAPTSDV